MRERVGSIELVAPGLIGTFDGAIELWRFGRQDVEGDVELLAAGLEEFFELAAAVDLEGAHGEGTVAQDLVEEVDGALAGGGGVDGADGPMGDRTVGSELFAGDIREKVQMKGVELEDFAGQGRPQALRQALGMEALHGASVPGALSKLRCGGQMMTTAQLAEDATDGAFGSRKSLPT
jgi:hypothetical protein